jgi:hypothetical protein
LRYERIDECRTGREYGEVARTGLVEFLKEPLSRKFGEKWYKEFSDYCRTQREY